MIYQKKLSTPLELNTQGFSCRFFITNTAAYRHNLKTKDFLKTAPYRDFHINRHGRSIVIAAGHNENRKSFEKQTLTETFI